MSREHDFNLLQKADFHDAGKEGLAVRLQTEPSPDNGQAYVLGFLLDEKRGTLFLEELAKALDMKWGTRH